MARRRARSRTVKGKPNYIWVASAGELTLVTGNSSYDSLLVPADWSGTVFEGTATLVRLVVQAYTWIRDEVGHAHAQNVVITMGDASEGTGSDTMDVSNYNDWADFCLRHDRVLQVSRLEWANGPAGTELPVQFSQLPEPVMNMKAPRTLRPDDSIRLWIGGNYAPNSSETCGITWFCRSLVRIGLR